MAVSAAVNAIGNVIYSFELPVDNHCSTVGKSNRRFKRKDAELCFATTHFVCYGCCDDHEVWRFSRICGLPVLDGVYNRYNYDYP